MKALYRLVKFKFRLLITLSLCLLAVYVAGGRYLLAQLPDYQDDLEAILSSSLHKPVTIMSLEGDWSGFDPEVRIGGIEIGQDGQAHIEQVTLRFGFLASILAQELRFKSLEILETNIVAKQHEQGWRIAGFDLEMSGEGDTSFDDSVVRRWLDGANISFIESHILVDSLRNKQRDWRLPSISLNYHDNEVYASGQLVHQSSLQPVMSFSVHGEGVLSNRPVDGEIYLEARSLHFLDDLLKAYSWKGLSIDELDAGGRVWADFDDFRLTSVQGDLQVRQLGWEVNDALQPALKNLATRFQWSASSPDSQTFSFNELSWDWEGQRCASSSGHLSLRHQLERSLKMGQLYLDQIDVDCVNRLMLGSDLPEGQLFDRMDVSQPSGLLSKVLLEWQTITLDSEATAELIAEGSAKPLQQSSNELGEAERGSGPAESDPSVSDSVESLASSQVVVAKNEDSNRSRFRLQAELDDLNLQAYEGTPSGSGINGYLYADENGGQAWLDSDNFELGFPDLFLEPWKMKLTQGVVAWKLDGDDTEVFSDGLRLHMPDGSLVYGDFLLRLNPDEDEDYLGLALAMQDVPFSKVTRFVPFFEVDEDLYKWLESGLVSGQVVEGVYYGYGSVEEDDSVNSFTSSLRVQAEDGVLKFDSEWPPIEELDASIELQNDALWIDAQRASIHGTSLVGLNAQMPATTGDQVAVLTAGARALTEGDNLRYWIAESPVAEHTGPVAEALEIEGVLEVELELSVPMSEDDVGYDVNTHFKNNRIDHALSGLSFEQVSGVVNVNSVTSVSAKDISLQVFDRPAQLSIESVLAQENAKPRASAGDAHEVALEEEQSYVATKVSLNGSATAQRVLEHFELWPVFGLSGELNYEAALTLPYDDSEESFLTVSSDQVGIQRQWPPPMQKQADSVEPMELKVSFSDGLTYLDGQVSIAGERTESDPGEPTKGHHLLARLSFPDEAETYGQLALNLEPEALTPSEAGSGLALYAAGVSGELSGWIDFVDDFSKALPDSTSSEPLLRSLNLQVDELDAFGQSFRESTIELMHHKAGWLASIEGDSLAGEISLPTDVRLLSLDLDHIFLSTEEATVSSEQGGSAAESGASQSPDEAKEIHPQDVPELSFRADKVVLNGINYGAWSTHLKHDGDGVRFTQLSGDLGGLRIAGQLHWQEREGHPSSYLELALEGRNVEGFFKQIGKEAPITSDRVLGNAALVWQDHPHEFSAEKVSGNLNLAMSEGFLKTPDEKTGALRLLGIFNAEALGRRLKLDFSDLYKSGIGYDSLEMAASIDSGRMRFEPPMKIKGPSSSYEIKGMTDLSKQSLDLNMSVTLPVTSNVPLAALMLGAPQVGGAVWLVDKLLGEPLSSITSVDYRVRGSWDDPKVELK